MKIVLEEELFFYENRITQREEKCKPFLEKNGGEWRCRIGGGLGEKMQGFGERRSAGWEKR